uniref:C-type lectin domain-containing protein n=1 Tax=Astyanax mexicanus TaxID=7994 RepID=A0A3B1J034_ASTMX
MFSILLFFGFCLLPCCLSHQYHFVKEPRSWAEAQSFCRHTYTDLATVSNMQNESRILESVRVTYNSSAWIGLYDDPNSSWKWSLDDAQGFRPGEKDFRNWLTTQAGVFRKESVCVLSDVGIWYLQPCETLLSFVCFDGRKNATNNLVLIHDSKNWTDAQSYCRKHHTDLASIRNRQENCRIADIVTTNFAWIGLYRTRLWSDQSNSSFRFWKSEDPYVSLESLGPSCTSVSFGDSGRWSEENCNITLPFICHIGPAGSLRQYCFVNEPKRWAEAQSYCRSNHTDLATVDNMNDMRKLLESAKGTYSGSAWIGLYDDPGHSWRWSLDDPQFYKEGEREFRRWNGHPLNECGIVCALMLLNTHPLYEGKWIEKSCAEEHQFICYKESNDSTRTYVPIADPKNWMDAQKYCREHYVDLASVRNQEQNLEIFRKTSEITAIQFVDGVWGVWIGLHRTRTWSDNSNSSFTYWKQGEPDDGKNSVNDYLDQHCTAVSFSQSGQWTDENCLTALPFFCYSLNSTAEPLPTPANVSNSAGTALNSTVNPSTTSHMETKPTVNTTVTMSTMSYSDSKPTGMPSSTVNYTTTASPKPSTEPNPAVNTTVTVSTISYNGSKTTGMPSFTVNYTTVPLPKLSTEPNPAANSTVRPSSTPANVSKPADNLTVIPSPTPANESKPAVNSTVGPLPTPANESKPAENFTVGPSPTPANKSQPTEISTVRPSPTPANVSKPTENSTIGPSPTPANVSQPAENSTVRPSPTTVTEPKPTVNSTIGPSPTPANESKPAENSTVGPSSTPANESKPAENSTVGPSPTPANVSQPTENSTVRPSPTTVTEPKPTENSTIGPSLTPANESKSAENSTAGSSLSPANESKPSDNSTVGPSPTPITESKPTENSTVRPSTTPANESKPAENSTVAPSPTPANESKPENSTVRPSTTPANESKPAGNSTVEPSPTPVTESKPAENSTIGPSPTPANESKPAENFTVKPSPTPVTESKPAENSTVVPSPTPANESKPAENSTVGASSIPANESTTVENSTVGPSATPANDFNSVENSTAGPLPTPADELKPAVYPTVESSSTPDSSTKPAAKEDADSGLIGLRAKVTMKGELSESEIEKLVLLKLEEEILGLGFPHNFRVRVRITRKITP